MFEILCISNNFLSKYQTSQETFAFRCAGQIKIGDEIVVRENYKMIPGKVIKISNFIMQGNHILFICISSEST